MQKATFYRRSDFVFKLEKVSKMQSYAFRGHEDGRKDFFFTWADQDFWLYLARSYSLSSIVNRGQRNNNFHKLKPICKVSVGDYEKLVTQRLHLQCSRAVQKPGNHGAEAWAIWRNESSTRALTVWKTSGVYSRSHLMRRKRIPLMLLEKCPRESLVDRKDYLKITSVLHGRWSRNQIQFLFPQADVMSSLIQTCLPDGPWNVSLLKFVNPSCRPSAEPSSSVLRQWHKSTFFFLGLFFLAKAALWAKLYSRLKDKTITTLGIFQKKKYLWKAQTRR